MRTESVNIYKFSELSDKAKKYAIEKYRQKGYASDVYDEAYNSLKEFTDIFDIKISQFDFEQMYRSQWQFQLQDDILQLSGIRLATYIWNNYKDRIYKGKYYGKLVKTFPDGTPIAVSKEHPNSTRHVKRYSKCTLEHSCVLTGWCYDDSVLDPIYKFLDNPRNIDFEDLLNECLYSLAKDACSEVEARNEDEFLAEEIEANEYEFYENGEMY